MIDKNASKLELLDAVEKIWLHVPDWRFGQLVINVMCHIHGRRHVTDDEIFNASDADILEGLKALEKYYE